MDVITLTSNRTENVVATLCDAFQDYPVMRYVLGNTPAYGERLPVLVGLFVAARALRNEPMLGIDDSTGLVAAAVMTLPESPDPPAAFLARREQAWRELGSAARVRYEAFSAAASASAIASPHHHLNMIGVRRQHQGRGLARKLLETVHELAMADPASTGVSLTTEDKRNLALYEHFGYRVHAHARVAGSLETWTLLRPRE